ncbi:MAG: dTMP kinase [Acidobacteriaceae bacterium]
MPRGFFITFEGLDGSGKSTQLRLLARTLQAQGRAVAATRQPGDTELGDQIRAVLLNSSTQNVAPLAEMALMFADRAQSIHQIIQPALAEGKIVLCDRFTDSTEAYQGGGRGLGSAPVLALHRAVCGDLWPDLTILLLPSLEASLARARRRNGRQLAQGMDENRFEAEGRAFYEHIFLKYREIAARESLRVVTIAEDAPVETIEKRIVEIVEERLARIAASS